MSLENLGIFVDGQNQGDQSAPTIDVINPSTAKTIKRITRGSEAEVDFAVRSARKTFEDKAWRRMPSAQRGQILVKIAEAIRKNEDLLATLESTDVGKPIAQARNDVRTTARYFEYYGGMVDKVLGSTIPVRWGALDMTLREPYGVSAQIVPWNYPLGMASRGIAPALAAGNCVVAKPAEDASMSLLALARLAFEAGLPAGCFNVVTGYGQEAGAALVRHSMVSHVTFTGSVATGSAIMKMAAEQIKPVSLELGGKSPNIVFADADLDAAAAHIARVIVLNSGQTCNTCSRLLVDAGIQSTLLAKVTEKFDQVRMGDPLAGADMGPVISAKQKKAIEGFLESAQQEGAQMTRHGRSPEDAALAEGFFVRPTVVNNVKPQHRVFREEIFGPVLAVSGFKSEAEAIELANDSDYGLNAGIFTKDIERAVRLAHEVQAGQIYVNGFGTGGSVEVPFGGMKKSGFNREKGVEGFLNYTQTKSVTIHFKTE
ncbi:MAG TPA: aldehyde dehydrogenase family protein [Alphaproteobacteria bacterium]|nr:aldehyde dehydrogenase family protein [Alphaproteobacteria bacterium]